jgi:hypothetical protein
MTSAIAPYRKLVLYMIGVAVSALAAAGTDDVITRVEQLELFIMLGTAFTAYVLPDTLAVRAMKLIVGAIGAGLVAIVAFLNSGEPLDTSSWLMVGLAVVSALGLVGTQPPEAAVPPSAVTEARTL